MVVANTPWYGWGENAFPGTVEKGAPVSYLCFFGPLVVFGAQAVYAHRAFQKHSETISKFYSSLILLNIIAMTLVTGPSTCNGLVTGYFREEVSPDEYPTAAQIIWYFTILGYGIHSVNNCCRVIYDAFGLQATIRFMPVAASFQLWQMIALPFGLSPYLGILVLSMIDYVQHITACLYWVYKIMTGNSDELDKTRAWYGVGGVILHMLSIIPAMVYAITTPIEDQTTGGLYSVYTFMIVDMFFSQAFWIKMALRTPPENDLAKRKSTPLAVVEEDVVSVSSESSSALSEDQRPPSFTHNDSDDDNYDHDKNVTPIIDPSATNINTHGYLEGPPTGWGGSYSPEVEVNVETAPTLISGPRKVNMNDVQHNEYIDGTRTNQEVSAGVMDRIKGLEDKGLQTTKRLGRMLSPRIITDVKEMWDRDGNITREMTHYIEEPDGTKRTEKETVYIAAGATSGEGEYASTEEASNGASEGEGEGGWEADLAAAEEEKQYKTSSKYTATTSGKGGVEVNENTAPTLISGPRIDHNYNIDT